MHYLFVITGCIAKLLKCTYCPNSDKHSLYFKMPSIWRQFGEKSENRLSNKNINHLLLPKNLIVINVKIPVLNFAEHPVSRWWYLKLFIEKQKVQILRWLNHREFRSNESWNYYFDLKFVWTSSMSEEIDICDLRHWPHYIRITFWFMSNH